MTRYTVRVVGDDGTSIGQGIANCSVLECSFIMHPQISVTAVNYTVFLASINGHAGPESNSTISGQLLMLINNEDMHKPVSISA